MQSLSARNPLGIVALFISLIYGICALLLGTSVDSLSSLNQERLTWFIIAFPVAILAAFTFLVTRHHQKLYGPGDFRSDEGFLLAGGDPARIGQKYIEEAQQDGPTADSADGTQSDDGSNTGVGSESSSDRNPSESETGVSRPDDPSGTAAPTVLVSRSAAQRVAETYLLEGLIMQDLQQRFDGPIRRDVHVIAANGRRIEVDGLVETPSGPIVVEVKRIRSHSDYRRRLREAVMSLREKARLMQEAGGTSVRSLLVVASDIDISPRLVAEMNRSANRDQSPEVEIQILRTDHLFTKYGLPSLHQW